MRAKARATIMAPGSARGTRIAKAFAAAKAVATKVLGKRFSGRLRGRKSLFASGPRAKRGAMIAPRAFARAHVGPY